MSRSGALLLAGLVAFCGALVVAGAAAGAPRISPPVVEPEQPQLFSLITEPEKETVVPTIVELYAPYDFRIDSFADAPGWHRDFTIQSRPDGAIQKTTWTREEAPKDHEELEEESEQDAIFQFVAHPQSSKTYPLEVRQTYSDGSVVHWTGSHAQAFPPDPAGTVKRRPVLLVAKSTGNGGDSPLVIAALILAALGLIVAAVALVDVRGSST